MTTPSEALNRLHDHYVEAINMAVADDDQVSVDRLAAEFDVELLDVMRGQFAA